MRIQWQIRAIEVAGLSTQSSVAFSPTGRAAVAYYSSDHHALRFATETDGVLWDISTVETVLSDCKPSLAFRFGRPAISYRVGPGVGGELRYALYTGGSDGWSIETVAPSAGASSLAFDPSHHPAISYYEPASKNLRLARSTAPSTWTTETVAESGDVGEFNSLNFMPSMASVASYRGQPATAYYDRSDGRMMYATFTRTDWGRDWAGPAMAPGPGVGRCCLAHTPFGQAKIAVAQLGQVTILANGSRFGWYGAGSARRAGTGWIVHNPARPFERGVSIDLDGSVRYSLGSDYSRLGRFLVEGPGKTQAGDLIGPFELTSTAISSTGKPAVSYYDISNRTIKVALGTVVRMPLDYVADFVESLLRRAWRSLRR